VRHLRADLAAAAIALGACGAGAWYLLGPAPQAPPPAPAFVGREACASCHAAQAASWQGSHHDLAMQEASEASVLGDFDDADFSRVGAIAKFSRRGGKYFVRTDGPDGKPADFEIRFTFGVDPLQQYLIELPGGRLQALGIAWDSRPRVEGGQRWFHLYPDDPPRAGDRLHWTGLDQNWNYMCAECHSTGVRKGYDAASGRFVTIWSEIDVSCESCHGPGSRHVAWVKREAGWEQEGAGKGLVVALDERRDVRWTLDAASGNAQRSRPREGAREIEACGRCHARATRIAEDFGHGLSLLDTHRVALLEDPLYWSDGQVRDEVYELGSFLQSRMAASGVTCSDCHDPHSLSLREPGGRLCGQCHLAQKYETPEHHLHAPGSAGADCVACHMPAATFMQVDRRHDHSLRVPRPDRAEALGVPNACGACHADRPPAWAAAAIRARHPQPKPGFQDFAEAFAAASRDEPGASRQLAALVREAERPAIVRASAAQRLGRRLDAEGARALAAALEDRDPLVRAAAVEALSAAPAEQRIRWLAPRLRDPVRGVRIEAARALAASPPVALSEAQRAALAEGVAEWIAAQERSADRPEALANLGGLHAERGEPERAFAAFARALALDPLYTPALVNRADLLRSLGREAEAEATLRDAVARQSRDADLRHALGLSLVRLERPEAALRELARAVELAPDHARFAYVYGVALHDLGRARDAIRVLETALARSPWDRDLLFALAQYLEEAGPPERALPIVRRLAQAEPLDPQLDAWVSRLESAQSR
jgi:tetratricopeptide (TPR) repeat protein